jgi:glyceraldehyde 3-phosphate dehydrogenase
MCTAIVLARLEEAKVGIRGGYLKTIHSFTNDQSIQPDGRQKDKRRARAVHGAIIDTETGAAAALKEVMPALYAKMQKLRASAVRIPTLAVSKIELNLQFEIGITTEELHTILKNGIPDQLGFIAPPKNELDIDADKINLDFIGDERGAIVDGRFTDACPELKDAHIEAWYDNVRAYVIRLGHLGDAMLNT